MEQEIKSEMGQEYLKEQVEALQKERDSLKVQNENLEKRLEEQSKYFVFFITRHVI
jgi:hypothetical protein